MAWVLFYVTPTKSEYISLRFREMVVVLVAVVDDDEEEPMFGMHDDDDDGNLRED